MTQDRWYVVQTRPHAEAQAIVNLERQAYEIFCPCVHKTVRHARKLKHVLAPLFPGYLFVRTDLSRDHWRSMNGTRGVVRLISQGEAPLPVPIGVVEALKARMGGDGAMDWLSSFEVGQAVRISDGPFVDFIGTLEKLDSNGRVRVLLNLLGRSVSVDLRLEVLFPAT